MCYGEKEHNRDIRIMKLKMELANLFTGEATQEVISMDFEECIKFFIRSLKILLKVTGQDKI